MVDWQFFVDLYEGSWGYMPKKKILFSISTFLLHLLTSWVNQLTIDTNSVLTFEKHPLVLVLKLSQKGKQIWREFPRNRQIFCLKLSKNDLSPNLKILLGGGWLTKPRLTYDGKSVYLSRQYNLRCFHFEFKAHKQSKALRPIREQIWETADGSNLNLKLNLKLT